LVILGDYSHYAWTFPLQRKYDVHQTLHNFHANVSTHFQKPILSFQTDNGRELDNAMTRSFLVQHGILLRLSCPYTSQQNGCAEHVIRTLNDNMRSMLF
jgi:histone deacetylase 1/2